jgi:hypothetical protein
MHPGTMDNTQTYEYFTDLANSRGNGYHLLSLQEYQEIAFRAMIEKGSLSYYMSQSKGIWDLYFKVGTSYARYNYRGIYDLTGIQIGTYLDGIKTTRGGYYKIYNNTDSRTYYTSNMKNIQISSPRENTIRNYHFNEIASPRSYPIEGATSTILGEVYTLVSTENDYGFEVGDYITDFYDKDYFKFILVPSKTDYVQVSIAFTKKVTFKANVKLSYSDGGVIYYKNPGDIYEHTYEYFEYYRGAFQPQGWNYSMRIFRLDTPNVSRDGWKPNGPNFTTDLCLTVRDNTPFYHYYGDPNSARFGRLAKI